MLESVRDSQQTRWDIKRERFLRSAAEAVFRSLLVNLHSRCLLHADGFVEMCADSIESGFIDEKYRSCFVVRLHWHGMFAGALI